MTKQRRSSWTPVIVSNLGSQADEGLGSPTSLVLQIAYIDGIRQDTSFDLKTQRLTDLRFTIGVALALALPAVIGLGLYEAAKSILLIAS